MTKQYHILIKSTKDPLGKIMSLIYKRYSDYYAKRYNHIGRIYQKRYFAKEVDSRTGILAVSSYIHRNPIDSGLPLGAHLKRYPYSSYPFYFDETTAPRHLF